MRFLGQFLKYLLRSVSSIIIFLLLVGLAKSHWNFGSYISFLDANDWSVFHRSQPATWADPFWPNKTADSSIEDILSDDEIEAEMSGLDAYDPTFEDELNTLPDTTISTEDEDFGFATEKTSPETSSALSDIVNKRDTLPK